MHSLCLACFTKHLFVRFISIPVYTSSSFIFIAAKFFVVGIHYNLLTHEIIYGLVWSFQLRLYELCCAEYSFGINSYAFLLSRPLNAQLL